MSLLGWKICYQTRKLKTIVPFFCQLMIDNKYIRQSIPGTSSLARCRRFVTQSLAACSANALTSDSTVDSWWWIASVSWHGLSNYDICLYMLLYWYGAYNSLKKVSSAKDTFTVTIHRHIKGAELRGSLSPVLSRLAKNPCAITSDQAIQVVLRLG